jgi:hypothetical protein
MELAVILALGRFLHPLTGLDGNGWAFGRLPAKSDLYPVIENVPGVDHVRSLEMATSASSFHVDRPDVEQTDIERRRRFLIYAGDIQVAATLEN